jgi:hypothetical protein
MEEKGGMFDTFADHIIHTRLEQVSCLLFSPRSMRTDGIHVSHLLVVLETMLWLC